ncbi:MAG: CvpA family protein [Oscillospiraceae bacterium]|nr:CvpA family protein [Oscillospiraceae bacterium]
MSENIWLWWDLAAAAIIVLCVFICYRQGFARTVIALLSYAAAAVAARMLAPVIAEIAYDSVIRDAITAAVMKELDSAVSGRIPLLILPLLPFLSRIMPDSITAQSTEQLVEGVIESTVRAPVVSLLSGVMFFVVFCAVLMLSRLVSRMFSGLYRIPVIGTADAVLGGIAGMIQAALILFVGSFAVKLAVSITGDTVWWLNTAVFEGTYIWYAFM